MDLVIKSKKKLEEIKYKDGDIEITFFARQLNVDQIQECIDKATEYTWDSPNKRTKKERFEKVNNILFLKERFFKSVDSWEGLLDEKKKPLPCTKKNKELIFLEYQYLADYVNEKMAEIEEAEEERRKKAQKN